MNWLDISILAIIGLSVLIGLFRGFIREALSLISWALAITAGVYFHDIAAVYLQPYLASAAMRSVIAFGIVFFVVLLVCSILSHVIGLLVKKSGLGGTDRMLGLLFGFCRGALVCAALLLVISHTPVKTQLIWHDATLRPYFEPAMKWLNDNIPSQVDLAKEAFNKAANGKSESKSVEPMNNIALLRIE